MRKQESESDRRNSGQMLGVIASERKCLKDMVRRTLISRRGLSSCSSSSSPIATRRRGGAHVISNARWNKVGNKCSFSNKRRREFSTVFSWGTGDDGQLGHTSIEKSGITQTYVELAPKTIQALEGQDVSDISCGFKHTVACTEDGRVLSWGRCEKDYLLGHDGYSEDGKMCLMPHQVAEGLEGVKIKSVACGEDFTAVLSEDGDVFTWGWGGSMFSGAGGLGLGSTETVNRPKQVLFGGSDSIKLKKIAAGRRHVIGLGYDGEVWTWGQGENGRLGNGGNSDQLEPYPVDFFLDTEEECVDVASGNSFCLALTKEGIIYGWGKNDQSQLGLGGGLAMDMYAVENTPRVVENLEKEKIVAIGAGGSQSLAINKDGEVYFWGMRLWMEPHKMTALSEYRITQADCGNGYSVVLSDAGEVFTWGKGIMIRNSGVLGQGDTKRCAQPKLIESLQLTPIKKVSCGNKHVAAVTGIPPRN